MFPKAFSFYIVFWHFAFAGSPEFKAPATFYKSPNQASVNKLWEIESLQQSSDSGLAKASSSSSAALSNTATVRSLCVPDIYLMIHADYRID